MVRKSTLFVILNVLFLLTPSKNCLYGFGQKYTVRYGQFSFTVEQTGFKVLTSDASAPNEQHFFSIKFCENNRCCLSFNENYLLYGKDNNICKCSCLSMCIPLNYSLAQRRINYYLPPSFGVDRQFCVYFDKLIGSHNRNCVLSEIYSVAHKLVIDNAAHGIIQSHIFGNKGLPERRNPNKFNFSKPTCFNIKVPYKPKLRQDKNRYEHLGGRNSTTSKCAGTFPVSVELTDSVPTHPLRNTVPCGFGTKLILPTLFRKKIVAPYPLHKKQDDSFSLGKFTFSGTDTLGNLVNYMQDKKID